MSLTISPRARIAAAAGVLAVMAVGTSLALFSDSGDVQTTFTSGNVDLKFDGDEDGNPTAYVIDFSDGADSLAPGTAVTYDLVVYNSGSIDAAAALATPTITNSVSGATEPLEDDLTLQIVDEDTNTMLYDGALADATFADLSLPAGGTTATGTTLAMTVTMSATAGEDAGGQTITVTLPFTASQLV